MIKGNAVIGQSGGPTSVINQSLVGVIETIRGMGHIDQLLGARHGVRGIIEEKFINLNSVPQDLLERIAATPASALGSTRDKPDQAYCEKIFTSFKKNNVRTFFYIGGNDSADAARIVSDMAKAANYELNVYHIPKTIDNDLRVNDHTPGFGSAARYVACATMGDNFDNASLPGVKINVIMGRNAGFLTAASVLARRNDSDGPHLVYVPEAPFAKEKFLADVDAVYSKRGRCIVSISEGICQPDGKTWAEHMSDDNLDRDAHGNIQLAGSGALGDFMAGLVTKNLTAPGGKKLRVRADTFGYPQRSFPGFTSEVDATEARQVGREAALASAKEGTGGQSIAILRKPTAKYEVEYKLTPLHTVARETKHLDHSYIVNGNNISQAFIDYALPLIGKLPVVGSFDELK
jgi:6-phosphofructokinase 1